MIQFICILIINLTFAVLFKDDKGSKWLMVIITLSLFFITLFGWDTLILSKQTFTYAR